MARSENRLFQIEKDLEKCYTNDIDWNVLPTKLAEVCATLGKSMKQKKTTVLMALISLFAYALGHADVSIKTGWTEPVVVWMAIVLKTGRCKSALHKFVEEIIQKVSSRALEKGCETRAILLPHSTWDKFGDILANSGGKLYGLFDELISFFSTMNMYSASKSAVQDNREYQDFLQLFTGKSKNRETITGNANYSIDQTSFTLLGFTQPQSAMPIIEDHQNNSKGFTSRILWYFPTPIYCRLEDLDLTDTEENIVNDFTEKLVSKLLDLYLISERSYTMEEIGKVATVNVRREHWNLTREAKKLFYETYNEWEINICEKNQHDFLISGLYSRGNSHVARLSLPILHLLEMFSDTTTPNPNEPSTSSTNEPSTSNTNEPTICNSDVNARYISVNAVLAAKTIVDTCLKHVVCMNGRAMDTSNRVVSSRLQTHDPNLRIRKNVLLSPGPIVSASYLLCKNRFRKTYVSGMTGAALARKVFEDIASSGIATIEKFRVKANKGEVLFLIKKKQPDEENSLQSFVTSLQENGVTLEEYINSYNNECEESKYHLEDYEKRKNGNESPNKRARTDE